MKLKIYLLLGFYAFGYLLICGYRAGAASGGYDCTGAETGLSNPMGCKTCHGSTATTTIAVGIELDSAGVATTQYVGGGTYTVTITGTNNSTFSLPGYGFQLGCIQGSTAVTTPVNEGTWSTTLPTSTHLANPSSGNYVVRMVEQSTLCTPFSGTGGTGSVYKKTFTWTAPPAGTGTISFWGVLNAVNNNSGAGSTDKWNTAQLVVTELSSTTGISELPKTPDVRLFPNPASSQLNISLDDASGNDYDMIIYSLNGQKVLEKKISASGINNVSQVDISTLSNGVYRVMIENNNGSKVIPFVKL